MTNKKIEEILPKVDELSKKLFFKKDECREAIQGLLKDVDAEFDQIQLENKELNFKLEELENETDSLVNELDQAKADKTNVEKEKCELERKYKFQVSLKESTARQLQQLNDEMVSVKQNKKELSDEVDRLKEDLCNQDGLIQHLEMEISLREKKISQKDETINELDREITAIVEKHKKAVNEKIKMTNEKKALEKKIDEQNDKINGLNNELNKRDLKLSKIKFENKKNEDLLKKAELEKVEIYKENDHLKKESQIVQTKFELVSRILSAKPKYSKGLNAFKDLIYQDFFNYSNKVEALDREAEATLILQKIEKELDTVVNFPIIATKNIIAIGGGFSSGKSAFINSFIKNDKIRLPIGIKPVTAIPTYVAANLDNSIKCFSRTGGSVEIDVNLNNNLSHDFIKTFGFNLKSIMPYMTIGTKMEKFDNICFVDTPGYNPVNIEDSTDEDMKVAKEYLDQASALIWVIGLDSNGTIPLTDIDFLMNMCLEEKHLYFVVNKADLRAESEIEDVIEELQETLEDFDIEYFGISAYSSNRNKEYSFYKQSLFDFLQEENNKNCHFKQKVLADIKGILDMYRDAIQEEIDEISKIQKEFKSLVLDLLEVDFEDNGSKVNNRIADLKNCFNPTILKKQLDELNYLELSFKKSIEDIFQELRAV
ncbi:MAG: dynamin family protein [Acetobacterium sp.]|uniref:dynamin family protein n=1 Tax=Acetobacterium sp. TaxID=1872094 RepID=UPI0032422896